MLELPPTIPFTSQVTAVLVEVVVLVRLTTAVKSVCAPGLTVAEAGVIETEVTVAVPLPPPHPERIPITANKTGTVQIERGRFPITEFPSDGADEVW